VWALLAGTAVNKAGDFLQLFIVLMVLQHGGGGLLAAAVLACYGTGELLGVAVAGPLTDRYGARLVVVVSMAVNAAAAAAVPVLPTIWLCLACGIGGAAANAYRPASAALLAVIVPADQRVPAFALQRMALNIGVTVAPLLGGLLAAVSYPALFLVDAGTSAVFATVAARCLPRTRRPPAGSRPAATRPLGVLHDRRFALFCAAMLLNALVYLQYLVALPILLHRAGLPATVFGVLIAANAALVLAIELPLSTVTARLSPRLVIVLGIVLVGAGEAAYGLAGGLAAFALGTLVWSFGEAFSTPVQSAFAADAAAPGHQGSYASTATAAATVGYAVGPAAGALLIAKAGPTGWTLTCLAVAGVAALAAVLGTRHTPTPTQQATKPTVDTAAAVSS
jgi:MFS family permease